jgi:integrase
MPSFLPSWSSFGCEPGCAARCPKFVILTACRTGEAIGATWPEIDEQARLRRIPAARMKPAASTRCRWRARRWPCSCAAWGRGDLTVHGFRPTFAIWCKTSGLPPSCAGWRSRSGPNPGGRGVAEPCGITKATNSTGAAGPLAASSAVASRSNQKNR